MAAAIEAAAHVIVTFNLSDFPAPALAAFSAQAMRPDDYLTALFDEAPELFLTAVRDHRASLTRLLKTAQG